jgi:predicted component of type VI protein secretion system
VLIGRSPDCDVVIDISTKISRLHCALVQVDADYYIRDLGSMNGVTVAGHPVEKEARLTNGVEVMIGDVKFRFLENVAPVARTAKPMTAAKRAPVLIDETVEVLDADDVEIVETVAPARPPAKTASPQPVRPPADRRPATGSDKMPKLSADLDDDPVEIIDAEVVDDLDDVEVVELADDIVEVVEIVEDVDIIEDVEVLDDVEVIDDRPPRRRPPRLR